MPATASPTPLALLQTMSLLSLSVESIAHSSFPADASRFAKLSSLSRSRPERRRLELFGSNGRAHMPRILDGNRGRSISGRKNADLVGRRLPTLCRANWEKFYVGPGRKLEGLASGSFLPDFERTMESNNHTDVTFLSSGWNREGSIDAFRQLHCESSTETPFQSKVENSPVFLELWESLGCLDGPGQFIGTGSHIFNRRSEAPAASSIVMDRSIQTECTDSRNEDVKGRPKSLRMLKRKHSIAKTAYGRKRRMLRPDAGASAQLQNTEGFKERLAGVGDSFKSAFSSSVFMIKTLQSHLLGLRKVLFYEDLQDVLRSMHTDSMQESFLWLFQQVFSCTPKLMLLTMVLLADFTVHSMSKNVALAEPPAVSVTISKVGGTDISKAIECLSLEDTSAGGIRVRLRDLDLPSRPASEGGEGNGGSRSLHVGGGGTDGQSPPEILSESRAMRPEDDTCGGDASISSRACDCEVESGAVHSSAPREDSSLVSVHWKAVSEVIDLLRLEKSCHNIVLDQDTKRMLVAPVSADLESDNYTCYDRTDLAYQYAIDLDPGNPLLLANYAQFLYLVRHDHNRAEDLFQRAMRADPVDGEVMGRFASFLWIAKGDLAEADRAYRAAVAADPTSCFHAGCYAHFLWNAGEEEESSQVNARSA